MIDSLIIKIFDAVAAAQEMIVIKQNISKILLLEISNGSDSLFR